MKQVGFLLVGLLLATSVKAAETPAAPEPSLEDQLQSLSIPANQAPSSVSNEKLYVVQNRFVPLRHRSEISVAGARNFTADGFLVSNQIDLDYRFYLSDRWFLNLGGSYVFNTLSAAGDRLLASKQLLPDLTYTKYRGDLLVGFHVFYGKLRLSMDQVFYFDQYVALGPGVAVTELGSKPAAVADVGFVFWFGRNFTLRLGVKDFFFEEQRRLSKGYAHNILGHVDFGWLIGGGSI